MIGDSQCSSLAFITIAPQLNRAEIHAVETELDSWVACRSSYIKNIMASVCDAQCHLEGIQICFALWVEPDLACHWLTWLHCNHLMSRSVYIHEPLDSFWCIWIGVAAISRFRSFDLTLHTHFEMWAL